MPQSLVGFLCSSIGLPAIYSISTFWHSFRRSIYSYLFLCLFKSPRHLHQNHTARVAHCLSLFALTLYAQMRVSTKNTIFIRRTDSNKTEANTYTYISIYSTARSNHRKTASHHICGLTLSVNHVFCMRAYFTLDVVAFQHYFACTTTTINTYGEHYLECLPTFILLLRFALFHINRSRILLIIILVHIVPPKERKRYGHFIPSSLCKLNILHVQLVVLSSGNYLKI